ncbi:MAG: family 1 extracellular solute-binding protein [Herbinix sp.]|jgi:raffinose/stachyose/melibiose transport system substrate-binding protein|nr:family 1 extracellular solute-binding protein [Herbinix sp.]
MKRIISTILVFVLVLASFTACGKEEKETTNPEPTTAAENSDTDTAEEPVEEAEVPALSGKIVIATNMTNVVDTTLKDLAQGFMDANPGTEIIYEAIKDYETVVATRISGGEAPDIYMSIDGMTPDTLADYFLPLDDLDIKWDDILFSRNNTGSDGKIYAIADSVGYTGIVYNKAAFKAAGVESVPRTMDEFWTVCEKLKAAGITPMVTAFKDIWPIYPWCDWNIAQLAMNGDPKGKNLYVDKDEIYDETILTYMNIIREMNKKGYLEADIMSANWDQLKLDMAQGKAGMYYIETWFPQQVVDAGANKEDVGMFPFPEAKYVYSTAGKSYGVSKDCENPDLAKAYLKYMIEGGKHALAVSTIPADTTAQIDDVFAAELMSFGVPAGNSDITVTAFMDIKNQIELDDQGFLLSYVLEPDDAKAKALCDEWNAKWAAARADIVK